MEFNIFVDGGARGNPGPGAVGVVIKLKVKSEKLKVIKEKTIEKFGKRIGRVTNNEAEYWAVIEALKRMVFWFNGSMVKKTLIEQSNNRTINIYLDSKLVCNQLRGLYKVKNERLRELLLKVRILEQEVGGEVYYHLIPREENRQADKLVNQVMDRA